MLLLLNTKRTKSIKGKVQTELRNEAEIFLTLSIDWSEDELIIKQIYFDTPALSPTCF
jgi:hypothetical protein